MSASSTNETLMADILLGIASEKNWSPGVLYKLETFIRASPDEDLFRINPVEFATTQQIAEPEAVDLFLHGAKSGLFEINWNLICTFCGNVMSSIQKLNQVHAHHICNFCTAENHLSLDDYIQVTFTVSPNVREITFHNPKSLSIEDYYFKYHLNRGMILPYDDMPSFIEVYERQMVRALTYIEPGEKQSVEIEINPGAFLIMDMDTEAGAFFIVDEQPQEQKDTIQVKLIDGNFTFPGREMVSQEVQIGDGNFKMKQSNLLHPGRIKVEFESFWDEKSPVFLHQFPPGYVPKPLKFNPCLTAKMLLTNQTFRNLFRSESVQRNEGLDIKEITFLFTDLKSSTELYERIGDLNAYHIVRLHFETLEEVVAKYSGVIVKTIGDAVMATFQNPLDAMRAATDVLKEITVFNQRMSDDILLKIGIHSGPSILVTLNDQVDYFGQTVNIAARIQGLSGEGEISFSQDCYHFPGVADLVERFQLSETNIKMKGIARNIRIWKITSDNAKNQSHGA